MRIGALARKTDTGIETIRYYERIGLLPKATREASGYRLYTEDFVKYLLFIKRCKDLGFALKEIQELLHLQINLISGQHTDIHALAQQRLADVDLRIRDLNRIRHTLQNLLDGCDENSGSMQCQILDLADINNSNN